LKLSEGNFRVELELDLLYIACTHLYGLHCRQRE
jgi:hypothetical protein